MGNKADSSAYGFSTVM